MSDVFGRIRAFFGVISRADTVEIAHNTCLAEDLPWEEPVSVTFEITSYQVMTKSDHKGGNVYIKINAQSGEVISAVLNPY